MKIFGFEFRSPIHRSPVNRGDGRESASNPPYNPPAEQLRLAPALEDFYNEDAVIAFINAQKDFTVDTETGIILDPPDSPAHWSQWHQFRLLARKVKVRTTTRWPDPNDFDVFEVSEVAGERVCWGLTGAGELRITVNAEFRKRLLDRLSEIDAPHLLKSLVLPKFESLAIGDNGVLEGAGMQFWNPSELSVCRELLREGWFDFPFLAASKKTNNEEST